MKIRIKEIIKNDKAIFIPQYGFLFWWFDYSYDVDGSCPLGFDTLQLAKDWLKSCESKIVAYHKYKSEE